MPNGFFGNASQNYLTEVSEGLKQSIEVHNQDPHDGNICGDTPPPSLPNRNNHTQEYTPETGKSGSCVTGVGNESNIVVDQDQYNEILIKIRKTDSAIAQNLYDIATQIEEMCTTIYIVPSTVPKYLRIVEKVKSSLDEFQGVSEQAESNAREFVREAVEIDSM